MAYDRYDRDHERWREDRGNASGWGRERSEGRRWEGESGRGGGREDRGWFERAGDEIASWFGSDDDDRREGRHGRDRGSDMHRERSGWESGRDEHRGGFFGRDRHEDDRDRPQERFSGREPWASSGRDYNPRQREMWGGGADAPRDERGPGRSGYHPMTGDYGLSEGRSGGGMRSAPVRSNSDWDDDDYRRSSYMGSARHDPGRSRDRHEHDPHYHSWRQQQMDELDRDYDDYRRENQSRFEEDFRGWRERRQQKRGLLGRIREQMQVVGSDDKPIGTVERVAGDRIILSPMGGDSGAGQHSLTCNSIDRVEDDRVVLDCTAEQARKDWRDENRSRALFERQDQGEAGPHMLDRSFEGTYR